MAKELLNGYRRFEVLLSEKDLDFLLHYGGLEADFPEDKVVVRLRRRPEPSDREKEMKMGEKS